MSERAGSEQDTGPESVRAAGPAAGDSAGLHRVLVVDDEDVVRRVLAALLRKGGFHVVEARDGFDALSRIQEARPHVILTDLNMPRCNGEQLCLALRNDPATAAIPVVAMTGNNVDERHMRELGCVEVLHKPLLPSLADQLRRVIADEKATHN
jgi:CheY-like chemotaxis protein